MDEGEISFGPFRLLPAQRLLLEGDTPVRLGSRAFDILAVLVEHAGRLVSRQELIARVWPNLFVEECNLKIQVSSLRRVLGDGRSGVRYIATVPGRGYEFVAPVTRADQARPATLRAETQPNPHNLPVAVTRMIGREGTVAALVSRLSHERLVTIVGPGGIGKTTLALAVAESLVALYDPHHEHGVWLIDLAPLTDPRLLPGTVAAALGLQIRASDPLRGLVASLHDRRMLLILDNCEHLIEAVAELAEMLLRGAPGIFILATSREPLGIAGEREHRLRPLAIPPPSPSLSAAEAMTYPAVQLFVERVSALIDDFTLSDADAPFAAEICRRVDGLPLAIEFAAARVEVLGIGTLAANLSESLQLLAGRRRGALPRHRTIRAVLDWSYGLLSEEEKRFFRRLGVFAGYFEIEAAATIAGDPAQPRVDTIDRLAELVSKSLVVADIGGGEPSFRLLETTRVYLLEKLDENGEREALARRHAEYYRDLLERAEAEADELPLAEWLAEYGRKIDDLRAALDWAFSSKGDASIGIALTAAAVPLWVQMSLVEELRRRIEQALGAVAAGASCDPRHQMKLHSALSTALLYAAGSTPEIGAASAAALAIAEAMGDVEYQLRSLWGLWLFHGTSGRHRTALEFAQRFRTLATNRPDPNDRLFGEGMAGSSLIFLGDLSGARHHLERALTEGGGAGRIIRFHIDQQGMARMFLARILWLQGFPNQAMRAAETCVEYAQQTEHAMSLCSALAHAGCPIALLVGDLEAAKRYIEALIETARRRALDRWGAFGLVYRGLFLARCGNFVAGVAALRAGLDQIVEAHYSGLALRLLEFLGGLAEALGNAGLPRQGLATVDEALARSEETDERWMLPELLRIKGELLKTEAGAKAETVEDHFRRALDTARPQGALSWELRAATSLARLWRDQGRSAEARVLLQPVYERFTEGFDTADLVEAKRLLDELTDAGRD